MKVSIFTPTHNPQYLEDAYRSIKAQAFDEWIILLNNGARFCPDWNDPRVRIEEMPIATDYVGALKRHAVSLCTGDILIELDHDDMLMPDAIDVVRGAFQQTGAGFVYTNSASFRGNFEKAERFDEAQGWQYRPMQVCGNELEELVSWKPAPEVFSRIWYAPHHLRAWTKDAYERAGGHDPNMRVLDDQDLLCRTYLTSGVCFVDRCCYLYRIDGNNTWLTHNAEIQNNTLRLHDKYFEKLCVRWAGHMGHRCLDLGGRFERKEEFESVDRQGADHNCDLTGHWPFNNESVGVIRAHDVIEHLPDALHTMREAYRVLAPGGYLLIQVPSTDGRGAFQDPTHKSFWNENSFLYYTNSHFARWIDTPVRFQAARLYTTEKDSRGVCWTVAHLIKLGKGTRPPGVISI